LLNYICPAAGRSDCNVETIASIIANAFILVFCSLLFIHLTLSVKISLIIFFYFCDDDLMIKSFFVGKILTGFFSNKHIHAVIKAQVKSYLLNILH